MQSRKGGSGPPVTELTDLTGLEIMVAGAAVAAVKAVGSNQITEILWRKSRKPRCSVNKQINRPINRKQTNAQDTPHQPFSQTLIILDDNSAFTVGNLLLGWPLSADSSSE